MTKAMHTDLRQVIADEQCGIKAAAILTKEEIGRGHDVVGTAGLLKLPHDGMVLSQELHGGKRKFTKGMRKRQRQRFYRLPLLSPVYRQFHAETVPTVLAFCPDAALMPDGDGLCDG